MLFPEEQTQSTKFRIYLIDRFHYFNSLDKIEKCLSKKEQREFSSIDIIHRCEVIGVINNPFK